MKKNGFVKFIILVVLSLIVLGFFKLDVRNIIESPIVQSNLFYVWGWVKFIWFAFLENIALWIWQEIFVERVWEYFQNFFNGNAFDFDSVGLSI